MPRMRRNPDRDALLRHTEEPPRTLSIVYTAAIGWSSTDGGFSWQVWRQELRTDGCTATFLRGGAAQTYPEAAAQLHAALADMDLLKEVGGD
jgi:hypothetical protein